VPQELRSITVPALHLRSLKTNDADIAAMLLATSLATRVGTSSTPQGDLNQAH